MADWLSATIGGLLNMGTSAMSSMMSYPMQKKMDRKAYQRQVALLQMQQNFAERMANTAHQREVADLRKAGLNPILSATGGQGAVSPVVSAPGVSQGSNVDFNFGSPGDIFGNVESASSALLNKKMAEKADVDSHVSETVGEADVGLKEAQARKVNAEAAVAEAKAAAIPSAETVSEVKEKAARSGKLITDPNTWRGISDFIGGASSARGSNTLQRKEHNMLLKLFEDEARKNKGKYPPDPKGPTLKIFRDKADYERGRKQFYRDRYRLKSPDEIRREYNYKQKSRRYFK